MSEIMINRMYAGDYLTNDLGHEVINLFKSDNGKNYIYALSKGDFKIEHSNKIDAVLLVRGIDNTRVEVLAKAEKLKQIVEFPNGYKAIPGIKKLKKEMEKETEISKIRKSINLQQKKFIDENFVTYGGVKLYDIFKNNSTEILNSSIYITFEAETFSKAKQPIYLVSSEAKTLNDYHIHRGRLSGSALATFYSSERNKEDFKSLQKILDNENLWEKSENIKINELMENISETKQNSFIRILKKEYDELAYSNMLAYFLEANSNIFYEFMKCVLKIDKLSGSYSIYRERANIDLLITDEKNVVVIENKIKSGLNGIKYDKNGDIIQTQLGKYYDHIYRQEEFKNKEKHLFIFVPDYNKLIAEHLNNKEMNKYKIIYYSEILKFFETQTLKVSKDKFFFKELLKALKIHANPVDNNHYDEMLQRLKTSINNLK